MKAEVKEIETAVTEAAQKNEKVDGGFSPAASATFRAWRPICWM